MVVAQLLQAPSLKYNGNNPKWRLLPELQWMIARTVDDREAGRRYT
jgi:hypothetical protein